MKNNELQGFAPPLRSAAKSLPLSPKIIFDQSCSGIPYDASPGERLKGWIGIGEGFSGGVSLSKSIVRGGKVYTTELNLGFGASVIPFVGVGGNTGTIEP